MEYNLLRPLLAGCIVLAATSAAMAQQSSVDIYVSAASSGGDGSAGRPLPDLKSAIEKIREIRGNSAGAVDVNVIMKGGVYRPDETVTITAEAFGKGAGKTVFRAAEGEKVSISGGVPLAGWSVNASPEGLPEVAKGQVWEVPVPEVNGVRPVSRQLWVNGIRMKRASNFDDYGMSRIILADKEKKELVVPVAPASIADADGLEVTIIQDWVVNFMRVDNMTTTGNRTTIKFKEPESTIEFKRPWPILRATEGYHSNHFFYFSNAIGLLNRPQEWFCDSEAGKMYYWPRYGETPETVEAVIPVLETIVTIDGTIESPVDNVEFRDIAFEHTTWKRPGEMGHVPLQAGQYIIDAYEDKSVPAGNVAYLGRPAAGVTLRNAGNISFTGCDFRNMGSTGLDMVSGTRNVTVQGCTFNDVGGNSILAGFFGDENFESHQAYNPENLRVVCDGITIDNNYIANTAADDWGCLGIAVGFAANVQISHNEICNTPYSAINMGWGWNKADNCMHGNHITANYIHNFANQMRDAGAIYTLSSQRNSSITGNRVEGVGDPQFNPVMWQGMRHSQFDLYTDEGTDYYTVKDNWLERGEISKNQNGSHNSWGTNNNTVSEAIKSAAGLDKEYLAIRSRVKHPAYAPVDSIVELLPRTADMIEYVAPGSGYKLGNALAVDLDNDNLQDIVFTGGEDTQTIEGGVRLNRGGYNFTASQPIKKLFMGNLDAGDLDGDGNIDLVQAGWDFWTSYNAVLMNDGKGHLTIRDLTTSRQTSPACAIADINNDGLPDIFFIGNNKEQSFYLQQPDRTFGDSADILTLPGGFSDPNIIYADFNNDRNIDICILSNATGGVYTRIFYNDGSGNFTERKVGFEEKGTRGGMAYADVNADGYLDVIVGGMKPGEQWNTPGTEGGMTATLYLNNHDGSFTKAQDFAEYKFDNTTQPVRFVDWNNDGHSDIVITGWNISVGNVPQTDVWLNDGKGHFTLADIDLPGVSESSIEPGDFSGEGVNDLLVSGNHSGGWDGYNCDRRLAYLVKNRTERRNTAPTAPTQLKATVDGNSVELEWNEADDAETPAKALTYNYYLRNTDTGRYLTFPNSDPDTGKRRVSRAGNAWQNLGWKLRSLPAGNYAWSVQSVDAGYAGSAFAPEQTFTIERSSGICAAEPDLDNGLRVTTAKGMPVKIEATEACPVNICAIDGRLLLSRHVDAGTTEINLAPGLYLVNSIKIAVR